MANKHFSKIRGKHISKFEANLLYRVSSRQPGIHGETLSKLKEKAISFEQIRVEPGGAFQPAFLRPALTLAVTILDGNSPLGR